MGGLLAALIILCISPLAVIGALIMWLFFDAATALEWMGNFFLQIYDKVEEWL